MKRTSYLLWIKNKKKSWLELKSKLGVYIIYMSFYRVHTDLGRQKSKIFQGLFKDLQEHFFTYGWKGGGYSNKNKILYVNYWTEVGLALGMPTQITWINQEVMYFRQDLRVKKSGKGKPHSYCGDPQFEYHSQGLSSPVPGSFCWFSRHWGPGEGALQTQTLLSTLKDCVNPVLTPNNDYNVTRGW